MFRSTALFATLICVMLAGIASDANAGCGSGRRFNFGSSFRPTFRYSQSRVQTIVHQPVVRRVVHKVVRPVAPKVVVAPRPAKPQLPTVPAGSTLTLPANFLGNQQGDVFMVFNKIKLPIKIQRWTPTGVTITLPPMAIKTAVEIRVDIVLPNGKLAVSRQLRVTKPASVVLHPVAPTSPLPTESAIQQQNGPQQPPVQTQPVAIAPQFSQPQVQQPVQPQVGQPIILSSGPVGSSPQQNVETNPILSEHDDQPAEVETDPSSQSTPPATEGNPIAAISKLIGG
ncbi:hypothetical protein ACFL2H_07230 [Planctomycetota bacterium]